MELARKAIGRTSPNPMVGCVIVKDGKIVGEGFHPKAGQPHGEVKPTFLSLFSCAIRMKVVIKALTCGLSKFVKRLLSIFSLVRP